VVARQIQRKPWFRRDCLLPGIVSDHPCHGMKAMPDPRFPYRPGPREGLARVVRLRTHEPGASSFKQRFAPPVLAA